ncbi:hypothetical protein Ahy_A08g039710 [Arachis hypogaea]|uniref:CCHC-type domain-containing protein n=1 Tax=Arachis hypogaea TaxID=3818 RepID=A0A445BX36_ARAHY|nr:hypothetical protein Ahy_A08g039710 [Arachis hypogaea]
MEGTANLVVYSNGEIIHNTHEGVRFVSQNPFSFVVPCTMTLMELQNDLCKSMENSTLMRVSRILYRNPIVIFGGLIQFDAMPITDEAKAVVVQNYIDIHDDRGAVYEGMNSDSEEDFEATYEAGDKDEDGDVGVEAAAENVVVRPSSSQPMDVPPFMRELDLEAMHAPEFSKYTNIGVADAEDGEFRIGMKYSSRKSIVAAIRSFTIAKGRIEASMQQVANIVVHCFDRRNEVFEVRKMTTGNVLVVDLVRRTCDCGHFQCLDWQLYVHDVYKMTEVRKVYRFEFTPLGDPEILPAYEGPTLVTNPAPWRTSKGRPKLTRYLNEMDSCDIRGPRICRLCGAQGHSRSRCP